MCKTHCRVRMNDAELDVLDTASAIANKVCPRYASDAEVQSYAAAFAPILEAFAQRVRERIIAARG